MTFDKVKTLGRKSFSDLRKAFKTHHKTPSQLEITTELPSHPPIPVQFLPHRNTPPVHHWENPSPTFLFMREHSIGTSSMYSPAGSELGTPNGSAGGTGRTTRTNSIHSSASMNLSMTRTMSHGGMGMSSSMSMGEMRMPVDVHRLSGALTIVTSASISDFDSPGVGGKKVIRGARLCEPQSPSMGPGPGAGAGDDGQQH
jgi:hypothetical protein